MQHIDRRAGGHLGSPFSRILAGTVTAVGAGLLLVIAPTTVSAQTVDRADPEPRVAEAWSQSGPSLYLDLDSRLWIEGTSTVRDFTCEAGVVAATLRAGSAEDPLTLAGLDQAVGEARVQIPGSQLDCDNDTMNDHMWDALEVEDHPDIRFGFEDYRVVEQSGDTATLELSGELTMAGVTRSHTISARAIPQTDGSLRVAGSTTFPMTEWEVEPPSLMFGLMKVGDEVEVHFDLVVRRQEPETSEGGGGDPAP